MKYLLILFLYSCTNNCKKGHYEEQLLPQSMVGGDGQITTILLPQDVWVCDTLIKKK